MNSTIKQKWIDALRSNTYYQTRNQLCKVRPDGNYGFCCLGVLVNLYLLENPDAKGYWDFENEDENNTLAFANKKLGNVTGILPAEVMKWADMTNPNPTLVFEYKGEKSWITLADMNDTHKMKFKTIANKIEKHL